MLSTNRRPMTFTSVAVVVAGVALACLVIPVNAAAPVTEIRVPPALSVGGQNSSALKPASQAKPTSSPQENTYYLLQSLRDELRTLRGMVEEQGNEIRQVKQRQVDDYLDLDRRVSERIVGDVAGNANTPTLTPALPVLNTNKNATPVLNKPTGVSNSDKIAYNKAYGVLKSGDVEAAKAAFKRYLSDYPKGRYVANTQYWLGEIYMLDNQLKEAGEAFSVVVEQFPAHRKVLDASFKLGKVYHLQGETAKAKTLLSRVASTSGSAGKLAGDYLETHF